MKTIKRGDLSVTLTGIKKIKPECKKTGYVLKNFKVCVQGDPSTAIHTFVTCDPNGDEELKYDLKVLRQYNANYPRKVLKLIKLLWKYKGE